MERAKVMPREGFEVRDEKGQVIPEGGAEVALSPVIKRRIREGLLEVVGDQDGYEQVDAVDLSKLKVDELKAMASEQGVEGFDSMKKAELIEALEALGDVEDED